MRENNFLGIINSKDRVKQTWYALQEKVKKQLAMFDSITFAESMPVDDVTLHQKVIRVVEDKNEVGKKGDTDQNQNQQNTGQQKKQGGSDSMLGQLADLVDNVIKVTQAKAQDFSFGAKRFKVVVVLFFKAIYMGQRTNTPYEAKLSSHSIDLGNLLYSLKNYQEALVKYS